MAKRMSQEVRILRLENRLAQLEQFFMGFQITTNQAIWLLGDKVGCLGELGYTPSPDGVDASEPGENRQPPSQLTPGGAANHIPGVPPLA